MDASLGDVGETEGKGINDGTGTGAGEEGDIERGIGV